MSALSDMPLWTTSSRLLKLGESLDFGFRLIPAAELKIILRKPKAFRWEW